MCLSKCSYLFCNAPDGNFIARLLISELEAKSPAWFWHWDGTAYREDRAVSGYKIHKRMHKKIVRAEKPLQFRRKKEWHSRVRCLVLGWQYTGQGVAT